MAYSRHNVRSERRSDGVGTGGSVPGEARGARARLEGRSEDAGGATRAGVVDSSAKGGGVGAFAFVGVGATY